MRGIYLVLLLATCQIHAQELVINVPITQPGLLKVDAGGDVSAQEPVDLILGEDIEIKGGSPEFLYTWRDEENNTENSQTINVTSFGKYFLTVTDDFHCTAVDSVQVLNTTYIVDSRQDDSFRIYPNPSTGKVFILLKGYRDPVRIDMLTVTGSLARSINIQPLPGIHIEEMDLSTMEKGLYLIHLSAKQKTIVSSVVLK